MKFYSRENEISSLRLTRTRAFEIHSMMSVVTGRRRIGKTSLISNALQDGEGTMLYFFVGRKSEAELIRDFSREVMAAYNGEHVGGL